MKTTSKGEGQRETGYKSVLLSFSHYVRVSTFSCSLNSTSFLCKQPGADHTDEVRNLKTEDVETCCLVRAIVRR